ncbi:MAG TPA: hypothetical protein VN841_24110 [Bryobacteraceae bacterium]|nr:hypothetical protein [Bryobacteraceae bacterium]
MSLISLQKRLRKLKRKRRSRDDNGFTLMELCRALWAEDQEHFKQIAEGTSLSVAVHCLQAEDALRESEQQKLRQQESRRQRAALLGGPGN